MQWHRQTFRVSNSHFYNNSDLQPFIHLSQPSYVCFFAGFQGGQSVRFNQISRATPAFNNYYRRRRPLPPNNPISRQRDRSYYTQYLAERYTAADRAREREYLAQARALIRAQSEQSNQFHNSTQNILGQYSGPPRNRRGRGRGYRRQY